MLDEINKKITATIWTVDERGYNVRRTIIPVPEEHQHRYRNEIIMDKDRIVFIILA